MMMRKILMAVLILLAHFAQGQTNNRMTKYDIGNSGCKAYFPQDPGKPDVSYSPDSAKVYTLEIANTAWGVYHFGLILVKLKGVDLTDTEDAMLVNYLDYLKSQFEITEAAGYGKGHTLPTHATAKGIIDYWKDKDGQEWSVKGWAAEQTLCIMFIYGKPAFANVNIQELFLNGFRFPGD